MRETWSDRKQAKEKANFSKKKEMKPIQSKTLLQLNYEKIDSTYKHSIVLYQWYIRRQDVLTRLKAIFNVFDVECVRFFSVFYRHFLHMTWKEIKKYKSFFLSMWKWIFIVCTTKFFNWNIAMERSIFIYGRHLLDYCRKLSFVKNKNKQATIKRGNFIIFLIRYSVYGTFP